MPTRNSSLQPAPTDNIFTPQLMAILTKLEKKMGEPTKSYVVYTDLIEK